MVELREFFSKNLPEKDAQELAENLLRGAKDGGEIDRDGNVEQWFENLCNQLVWLEAEDYIRALVRAVWLAPKFAATDFGSARQRDLAQVWTDAARGFLGEIALQRFLMQKFNCEIKTPSRRGELQEFLPTDIDEVKKWGEAEWRPPNIKVSIKTTKFNGRWLDLPGAQFQHSDVFILVKLGIARVHFLSFLKSISFVRDKLLPKALELGELDEQSAQKLWDELPEFRPIPAYLAGFLFKEDVPREPQLEVKLQGRKKRRLVIMRAVGLLSLSTARQSEKIRQLDPSLTLPIEVEPIIGSLSETPHFLAHSGALQSGESAWNEFVKRL